MKEIERISAAIKALRIKLGETHSGMARLLGASLRTYDRWEAGNTIPAGSMLVRILALCPDEETRLLFDAAKSSPSEASKEHQVSSSLRRAGPEARLRMRFRDSCLASIEIIYESAVLGSQAADDKLRGYVTELNREAVILTEGLLNTEHRPEVSLQQNAAGELSGTRSSKRTDDRSRTVSNIDSSAANLDGL
jgi:transcriptional regulator with XRE-family HTH domain